MIKMNDRLLDALEDCITAMYSGRSIQDCLAKYPDLADELEPLLFTTKSGRSLSSEHVPATARNRSRMNMLAQAAKLRKTHKPLLTYFRVPRLAMSFIALVIVLMISFNGLIITSAKTLPGDTLYPVKRAAETVRLQLTNNVEKKHQIEVDYTQRRTEEVSELLQLKRTVQVSMEGTVQEMSPEIWVVSGIKVQISPETKIIGNVLIGQVVEVEGSTSPNGRIAADELHLRYYEITDIINEIGNDEWTIGTTKFVIAPDTQINPALVIGDQARVLVYSSDDGSLYARAILSVAPLSPSFVPFEISFSGIVDMLTDKSISIDGKTILLTDSAVVSKGVTSGSWAHITVLVDQNGMLTALRLEPLSLDNESQQTDGAEKTHEDEGDNNGAEAIDDVDDNDIDDQDEEKPADSDDISDGDEESDSNDEEQDDGISDDDSNADDEDSGDNSGGGDDQENDDDADDESDTEQDDPIEEDGKDQSSDIEPQDGE